MQKQKNTVAIFLLLGAVLLFSGCGRNALLENQMEKGIKDATGQNAQVDINKDGMKLETPDGTAIQTGEDVKLPDDFPKDIYVIDGKIIVALKNMYGIGYNLSIMTDKTVDEAKKLYEEKLKADGWKIGMSTTIGEIAMFSGQKDNRTVSISIMVDKEKQKTSVVVTLSEQPKQ